MENQIDLNYFTGSLSLPGVGISAVARTASGVAIDKKHAKLEREISVYQKEFLTLLFGSEVIPEEVAELMTDDLLYISPIANYVYCKLLPQYASRSTEAGEKVKNVESSSSTDYQGKVYDAWNRMVYMNGIIRERLYSEGLEDTYPTDFNNPIYKLQSFIW